MSAPRGAIVSFLWTLPLCLPLSFACSMPQTMANCGAVAYANIWLPGACFIGADAAPDVHEWSIWCTELYNMPLLTEQHINCTSAQCALGDSTSRTLWQHFSMCWLSQRQFTSLFSFGTTCEAITTISITTCSDFSVWLFVCRRIVNNHRLFIVFVLGQRPFGMSMCSLLPFIGSLCSYYLLSLFLPLSLCVCVGMGKQTEQNAISSNQLADEVVKEKVSTHTETSGQTLRVQSADTGRI